MGWQAVEAVVTAIAGQAFIRTPFPVQLRLRHSCGCLSQAVIQTVTDDIAVTDEPFEIAFAAQRPTLLHAFQSISQETGIPFAYIEHLIEAFAAEIRGNAAETFIGVLNDLLTQTIRAGGDLARWQEVISVFYHHVLPYLPDRRMMVRAENIWQQSRILIGEMVTQMKMSQASQKEQQTGMLFKIIGRLVTAFDIEHLMDILAEELPAIEIPAYYLSVYQDPQAPTDMARLMLAYTEQGRMSLGTTGQIFPAKHLVPAQLLPQDRQYALLLQDLYFHDQQIGFVLFEVSPQWRNVYETLCGAISSALQGALLVQRVQEHSAEITRQKYVLDTFMANVPDSIYFKDRASRITHANRAHASLMGFRDPAEEIGKSDFDFFPEAQARPKYEQEQNILRTGQPLLGVEEPDAQGKWSLTTKMPLRDEHGQIIGTFGISRDITPLKQAQLEVAAAYEEIKILNHQLQEENLRMSAELDVSRRIQQMVLPSVEELRAVEGLEIVGYMKPADEVGGDYYDVLKENGMVHIGIGDVTGHGLESGVLMLMTQTAIRTLIEHGETDPVVFLSTLNRILYKNLQRMKVDKTLTLAFINYQHGQVKLIGQHEELLLVRKGGQVERVDTLNLGFPLGLEEQIADFVAEATIALQPGDSVVLYTDGITEAENAEKHLYGIERLCEVVGQHWDRSAEAIKQAVIDDVTRYIGQQKVYDDLTLVVLKQK
jgi:PAS domain S-box-containing protein